MFVRECLDCGYTIGDPESKLDAYKYNTWCFKCNSSAMRYRKATTNDNIKMFLKIQDVYRTDNKKLMEKIEKWYNRNRFLR